MAIYTYNRINNNDLSYLQQFDFNTSKIISCSINNENIILLQYKLIRNYIYILINNVDTIMEYRTIYISKLLDYTIPRYTIPELGIYVWSLSNTKNIKEILTQSIYSNINIQMTIKLVNGNIIKLDY